VGAAISQTGAHAELALQYARGLELWRDETNAAGGLLGRSVELRFLDDGSQAVRARALYTRLIDEKADLLVGPYGSAATLVAAAEAERARRVMVNGSGAANVVHSRAPRYLFQSAVPYAAYGERILKIAADAGYRRLYILARDDAASREMAEGTQAAAAAGMFVAKEIAIYNPGAQDFAPQVAQARGQDAQAWIAFGDVREAAEMVKTFRRLNYAPALFFARGVSHPRLIPLIGQDAEFALGSMDLDPRLAALQRFANAYTEKWRSAPSLASAQGYAAGTVLGAAVRSAGSLDQEKLRSALAELELPTVLGDYRVAPENGVQTGARPVVVQIRNGKPEPGAALLPYPQWEERSLIQ
jgi:branched-chain amino acid transport system substrate-binding protein